MEVPEGHLRIAGLPASADAESDDSPPEDLLKSYISKIVAEGLPHKAEDASYRIVHERVINPELAKEFPEVYLNLRRHSMDLLDEEDVTHLYHPFGNPNP